MRSVSVFGAASLVTSVCMAQFTATNYTTDFESYLNGQFLPTPSLPGPYNALYWSVFQYAPFSYESSFCAGVCPQSFPNDVAFGNASFGNPSSYALSPGPASISTIYNGSQVQSFDLYDFYFGCLSFVNIIDNFTGQPMQYTVPTPANCTLTVHGYHGERENGPATSAKFDYIPIVGENSHTGAASAPMMHAILPARFKHLKTASFNATTAAPYLTDPGVYVDNVSYMVRNWTRY